MQLAIKKNVTLNRQFKHLCFLFPHCRVRYKELLFNFNELQSEKTTIQQKFEFGVSSVKAFKADMKVKITQSVCVNLISEVVTNIIICSFR